MGRHKPQGRRARVGRGGQASTSETTVTAAVISNNTTGSGLVQIVLPLKPGIVTDQMITDRKITVMVNGVEQQVFIKAARGKFPAGFMNVDGSNETLRGIHGHFTYNIPSVDTPISAQFIIGRTRSTSDILETTITDTHITNRRVMVPTEPSWLCDTWLTLERLVPASSLNAQNTAYFVTKFDEVYEDIKDDDLESAFGGPATYESNAALIAAWCMTADMKYFWKAWYKNRKFLNYNLPNNGTGFWSPELNPNSVVTGLTSHSGIPGEAHSQRYRSFIAQYMLTGLIEYWNVVCSAHMHSTYANSTAALTDDLGDSHPISGDWGPRFNLRGGAMGRICAVTHDTTKVFSNPVDGYTGRAWGGSNAATEFPWYHDAIELHKFDAGGFRNNLRGFADTATDGGARPAGDFPFFQHALTVDYFLRYFFNVKADATVAGWIKDMVDITLNCITPARGQATGTIGTGCGVGGTSIVLSGAPTGRTFYIVGETVTLGHGGGNAENRLLTSVSGDFLTLGFDPTTNAHSASETVLGFQTTDGFSQGTAYGYTYMCGANANNGLHLADDPWTLPMWAAAVKFCEKYFGNNTVNGATYSTWYTRLIDPLQLVSLIFQWKQFGESWGTSMLGPYLDQFGIPSGLPTSIRSPTQY